MKLHLIAWYKARLNIKGDNPRSPIFVPQIGDNYVTTEQAWYIGQRAESLTVVYLTRRSDLIVTPQPKHMV